MQFELDEIMSLIDKVKETNLDTFEYQDMDVKLKIKGKKEETEAIASKGENMVKKESNQNKNKKSDEKLDKKPVKKIEPMETVSEVDIENNSVYVDAPLVGTFYHAPAEGAEPFVKPGDRVTNGQVIGIIEAMKLMNEIQSEVDGIVEEILVPNETLVEFGQHLVRVRS